MMTLQEDLELYRHAKRPTINKKTTTFKFYNTNHMNTNKKKTTMNE